MHCRSLWDDRAVVDDVIRRAHCWTTDRAAVGATLAIPMNMLTVSKDDVERRIDLIKVQALHGVMLQGPKTDSHHADRE